MLQEQLSGGGGPDSANSRKSVLLALGSNLTSQAGPPVETLKTVLQRLSERGATIRAVSPFYATPAFPIGNGPDFVNAALCAEADWDPAQWLEVCHGIEAELDRERTERWGARTVDIDLIAIENLVLPDPVTHARWRSLPLSDQLTETPSELILPHPRLQDRAFVLVPLETVAPDWVHPLLGMTVAEMRAALDPAELAQVRQLE